MRSFITKCVAFLMGASMMAAFMGTICMGIIVLSGENPISYYELVPQDEEEWLMKWYVTSYFLALGVMVISIIYATIESRGNRRKIKKRKQLYEEKLPHINKIDEDFKELKKHDIGFSKDKFIIRIRKMYLMLQQALKEENERVLRVLVEPSLVDAYVKQIEKRKENNFAWQFKNMCITQLTPYAYEVKGEKEYIYVELMVEGREYVERRDSKKIVQGTPTQKLVKKVHIICGRTKGTKTSKDSDHFDVESCPCCGAPLKIDLKGICEYCGELVSSDKFNWCIEAIEEDVIELQEYRGI
ncbi:MAG: TIM44-like domain-containing protein [Cellulosilyticaceae bacterium]